MIRAVFLSLSLALALPAAAAPVEELVAEKARDTFGAELPSEGEFKVSFQRKDLSDAVLLSAFWMDRATGQFLANAVNEKGEVSRLQGLAILTVTVPVPVRRMLPGDIIGAGDIQMIDLPHSRVGAFSLIDPDTLVGKQVRRVLAQGRPVMAQSVAEPLVITRGDKVSITFEDGRLALSAPGRAMADAVRGDEVRVVNLASNTLVTGIARGEGIVEVTR